MQENSKPHWVVIKQRKPSKIQPRTNASSKPKALRARVKEGETKFESQDVHFWAVIENYANRLSER